MGGCYIQTEHCLYQGLGASADFSTLGVLEQILMDTKRQLYIFHEKLLKKFKATL